jgi:hypothetical protein
MPLMPPIANKGFLDDVLRIGKGSGPLAGAKQQLGAMGFKPVPPVVSYWCRFHSVSGWCFLKSGINQVICLNDLECRRKQT